MFWLIPTNQKLLNRLAAYASPLLYGASASICVLFGAFWYLLLLPKHTAQYAFYHEQIRFINAHKQELAQSSMQLKIVQQKYNHLTNVAMATGANINHLITLNNCASKQCLRIISSAHELTKENNQLIHLHCQATSAQLASFFHDVFHLPVLLSCSKLEITHIAENKKQALCTFIFNA